MSVRNLVRAVADHNVIEITIRLKGMDTDNQESRRRDWKNLNLTKYVEGAAAIQWDKFYTIENLDVAQYWMERKLTDLLDREAHWMTIQPRRNFKSWISMETKSQIQNRDSIREAARETKSAEQWRLLQRDKK